MFAFLSVAEHYNPLKNTTYHRIMNGRNNVPHSLSLTLDSLLILEQDSNELYTKKQNTVGLPIWWWRHRLYSNLKRDSLSENRNTGSACDFSFGFGVSWVIDKYINYGQLVLMFSDHDSIATGAWVLFRIYNFERERFDMEKRKRHSQSWSLSLRIPVSSAAKHEHWRKEWKRRERRKKQRTKKTRS